MCMTDQHRRLDATENFRLMNSESQLYNYYYTRLTTFLQDNLSKSVPDG